MKVQMQIASLLTIALLFSACGSSSSEKEVESSSITPIEIPESDSGYENFTRTLSESNENGIVIEDSYGFNTFLTDVEQQEGWDAKTDFLTAIKQDIDFSNSNLMIYCVNEKPSSVIEARGMITTTKARIYIVDDNEQSSNSENGVATTSYIALESSSVEPVVTTAILDAEAVTTDLEVTTTEASDTSVMPISTDDSVMPIAEKSAPYCFSYAVDKELESVVIENNNEETVINNRVETSSDLACTMEYMPVCGSYENIEETFGNSCMAKAAGAEILYSGECGTFDFPTQCTTWYDGCNTCSKDENGNVACTEMYCAEPQGQMMCLD